MLRYTRRAKPALHQSELEDEPFHAYRKWQHGPLWRTTTGHPPFFFFLVVSTGCAPLFILCAVISIIALKKGPVSIWFRPPKNARRERRLQRGAIKVVSRWNREDEGPRTRDGRANPHLPTSHLKRLALLFPLTASLKTPEPRDTCAAQISVVRRWYHQERRLR